MYRLFVLALLLAACEDTTRVGSVQCTQPCYGGPSGTEGVGACHAGAPVCTSSGAYVRCEGEVRPGWETCNGLDDNCNGRVDEPSSLIGAAYGQPCGPVLGECARHPGHVACIDGAVSCADAATPQPETCNGLDDNCNGVIDEVLPRFCDVPDPQRYITPPCSPGLMICFAGHERCVGQRAPEKEICDQIDNDCNGAVDDTGGGRITADIVLVVDESCSMADPVDATISLPKLELVRQALFLLATSTTAAEADVRFWLYDLPSPDDSAIDAAANLGCVGCTPNTLTGALASLHINFNGLEPSIDIAYDLITGAEPVRWRPGAGRIIIEFTDEIAQSTRGRVAGSVATAPRVGGPYQILVYTAANDPIIVPTFTPFAEVHDLLVTPQALARSLGALLARPCRD